MRLAESTGREKNRQKIVIWAPSHNFVGLYLRNEGMYRQSEKNILNSNTSSTCPDNMVNFGPLAAEIGLPDLGTPTSFNGFASWQRYCTALQYWASAKLCGVEQRSPPISGRAAIALGIGPHSSFVLFLLSFFLLFSSPMSYHTSTHGVALVRI